MVLTLVMLALVGSTFVVLTFVVLAFVVLQVSGLFGVGIHLFASFEV